MSTATDPKLTPVVVAPATICRVRANQATFKEVSFTSGFNVVLAERTKTSDKKDSRNGLGKSTLIEIITFCLGSGFKKADPLANPALEEWSFTLDLSIDGRDISVTRSIGSHQRVSIEGDTSGWPVQPTRDRGNQTRSLKVADWNLLLGSKLFGMPAEGFTEKYAPTFRSSISYSIRRGKDAYSTPFEHFRKQQEWDKQVNNAFLLGLAWTGASEWQVLKDEKKVLAGLKSADKSPIMNDLMQGSMGELEATKVRLEAAVRESQNGLASFEVLPQYRDIETKANELTTEIASTANQIIADRQLLNNYEASLRETPEPNLDEVVQVYQEAGVFFPGHTTKRFEDVKEFHRQLIDNRRRFLSTEIERLQQGIEKNESVQKSLIAERASMLQALKGKGALDEHRRLQDLATANVTQLNAVQERIAMLRRLEESKSNLRIREEKLKRKTRNDLDDRKEQREHTITIFNQNSQALYESPGNLVIDVGKTGFRFDVEILRSASQGVGNMKILCYDLMLSEIWSAKSPSPRLLIHDSHMYDGVDERQVAHALELAARKSRECGFQYICALNSDVVPWNEFTKGFDFKSYVSLTLTDRDPSGSLLGIRY